MCYYSITRTTPKKAVKAAKKFIEQQQEADALNEAG